MLFISITNKYCINSINTVLSLNPKRVLVRMDHHQGLRFWGVLHFCHFMWWWFVRAPCTFAITPHCTMLLLVLYDVNVWGVEIWLGVGVGKQSLSLHYSLVLWWDVFKVYNAT
jgi:hypothetical protein